jgi:hypothetical protein
LALAVVARAAIRRTAVSAIRALEVVRRDMAAVNPATDCGSMA